jgi:hypothetical protein
MITSFEDVVMSNDVFTLFESYALHEKAVAIEASQESPSSNPELATKPLSMRLPLYKIAALEAIAVKMSITRQELILKLVECSLGSAISGYVMGWEENDSTLIQNSMDFVNEIDSISSHSKHYLQELVLASHGLNCGVTSPEDEHQ